MNALAHAVESSSEWRLFTALAIGLLIGIERERHKFAGTGGVPAGLRTFALMSFLGGLAAQTGSAIILGLVGFFAVAIVLIGYRIKGRADQGMTTQIALVAAAVLGVLAQSQPALALGASVVVVLIIASRSPLHRFARELLTEQDLRDGLFLSIAALVVLPLLPNHAVDPFGLVNPFALWRLAVVLMGLSALSYGAMRVFGPRYGLPLSGLAGGFISSTATIATLGSRAKSSALLVVPCAAGAVASILGSLLFLIALVGAADPGILQPLVRPFAVAGALLMTYALVLAWRARATDSLPPGSSSSAFEMKTALIFAGLVAAFSLVSWALMTSFGEAGIFASVAATALIDAHAAAVSVATLVASGKLNASSGAFAILVGFSANMIAKVPTAFAMGPPRYARRVTAGLIIVVAGLWSGYGWSQL
jgi:uncharacterized membrane protein (DUF4010 family)